MEKKPLFHFYPGQPIFSIGTAGCNLHCRNCQNAELSQGDPERLLTYELPPDDLPARAAHQACRHVAYTYAEPLVSHEYTLACCQAAHAAGLTNVLVTAGYINEAPLAALLPFVDAANLDIKAFSDSFYREVCDATLAPVLRTAVQMHRVGVHLELTNLVIPTLNDHDDHFLHLCRWIIAHLGPSIPLHFSRFFPCHRMKPFPATPVETLLRARECAKRTGLHHVYIGNVDVPDGGTTFCSGCGRPLIRRIQYDVRENRLCADARCPDCGTRLYGHYSQAK